MFEVEATWGRGFDRTVYFVPLLLLTVQEAPCALVHLLIAVFNDSAISGAITNYTHGVTDITPPVKSPKISTRASPFSRVLIFWGISTGDVIYSTQPCSQYSHTHSFYLVCTTSYSYNK